MSNTEIASTVVTAALAFAGACAHFVAACPAPTQPGFLKGLYSVVAFIGGNWGNAVVPPAAPKV